MMAIWAEIGVFETNEQRFADQTRIEMEEIKRKLSQERVEYHANDWKCWYSTRPTD